MALKGRFRPNRPKRIDNVGASPISEFNQMTYSSSDSELEDSREQNKVRKSCFSIKQLRKDGENLKIDGDHIYSSGKSFDLVDVYQSKQSKGKRRRTISEEDDEKPMKMRCSSKNAVMARLNRERKKRYVSSLETENEELRKENDEINKKIIMQNNAISAMKREISYLKGLLANSKELCQILQNLKATTGLPVTSSFILPKDLNGEKNNVVVDDTHPRIRTVNEGYNFPILDKDVNLGSSLSKSYSGSDLTDFEIPSLEIENNMYENFEQSFNTDSIFDNNSLNLDLGESSKFDDFLTDVGICLHVNKKKISVEMCSICNSKASLLGSQTEELTPAL